ncbi:MAG TPA: hypothetical protein VF627_07395, partial [Abditibacterium sp.]
MKIRRFAVLTCLLSLLPISAQAAPPTRVTPVRVAHARVAPTPLSETGAPAPLPETAPTPVRVALPAPPTAQAYVAST